jgi:phosphoribosylaminoimidazole (AIR) synthetase
LQYRRGGPEWNVTKQEENMAEKLGIGAAVPKLTLKLVGGGTATVPDLADAKYQLVLFYRGHW